MLFYGTSYQHAYTNGESVMSPIEFYANLGYVWIKDLVVEKEMKIEKLEDPTVPNRWIF